jgi:hypothetical protein
MFCVFLFFWYFPLISTLAWTGLNLTDLADFNTLMKARGRCHSLITCNVDNICITTYYWIFFCVTLKEYVLLSSALRMQKRRTPSEKNLTANFGGRTALNFTDLTLKMCSVLRTKPLRSCSVFYYVLSMSKHNYSRAKYSCATLWIANALNVMILLLVT